MAYMVLLERASRLAPANGAVLTLAGRQAGLIVAADLNGLMISLR
jgi:hypothetical protein